MPARTVTVVTPEGLLVTGVPTGRPGRPGSVVTVATRSGPVTGRLAAESPRPSPKGAAVGIHPVAAATTILPESPETRFVDAGITAAVAAGSVLWTASRPTVGSQLGWATFWTLLGGLMAVEGRGELQYAGFGVLSSNASFMALRLLHPNLQQG